jgi:type IV pilus assembly protein PilY1
MKTKTLLLLALALGLFGGTATAATTNIAQVPLLNITGTGTVKPNLMLLYDDSGSMVWTYTPDFINASTTCRSGSNISDGTTGCVVGHAPYMSPHFNKQYYNPETRYSPAVRADGSSYTSMTRANTSDFTAVPTDAFNINLLPLGGSSNNTSIDLTTGFPDLRWCTSTNYTTCAYNTASYTYPTNTYKYAKAFTANPYYYTINAAEYCTDATLVNCQTVASPSAPAPAGYPVAAPVRYCTATSLATGTCKAKYIDGSYVYPRFSGTNGAITAGYGTVTVGGSASGVALNIASVTVVESGGPVVITTGAVTAAGGTNSTSKQATLATDLALAIINKTGLANQYSACVQTPTGTNAGAVPACSTLGIALGANNVVAVIPLDCIANATNKATQCSLLADDSRSGWAVSVAPVTTPATALLTVSGTASGSNAPVMSGVTLGSVQLFSTSLTLAKNNSSATVAAAIAGKIGTGGTIKAYVGGDPVSPVCAAANSSVVCLVDASATGGAAVAVGNVSNNTSSQLTFAGTSATTPDKVPASSAPLSAGSAVFVRVDIIPARTSYPKGPGRSDCAASTCTYDEEMTNFANWYSYYRTRNQMMKTSVGLAFQPLTANYKVGIVPLSVAGADGGLSGFTLPKPFSGGDRTTWYAALYGMGTGGSTPMRVALNAVGKMYSNKGSYAVPDGVDPVVQFPCQQNFTFITTDGYWNGGAPSNVTNNDNAENAARFCTRARGCVDPAGGGTYVNSLADVALYWYNGGSNGAAVPLRDGLGDDITKPGQVPAAAGDNTHLHMNTYALGLGVDGYLNYEAAYDTAPIVGGDFYKLITAVASGCPWNGNGAYNWPDAATNISTGNASYQSRVDDLWHAAINGRGKYFSASDPKQVVAGLSSALANIAVKLGAAAAAATSTPNISQQDNDIFSDTFTTVKWYGELSDKKIDIITGVVGTTAVWNTSDVVGRRVAATTDSRVIKWLDPVGKTLVNFSYGSFPATANLERSWFDSKCGVMAQCTSLSAADQAIVNSGTNLVNWLRGQQQYANDRIFRAYGLTDHNPSGLSAPLPIVLGDIASSKPAYMREPRKGYNLTGYPEFVVAKKDRAPTVFAAANDGMLHAFNAASGDELWAYVPRITMKKLAVQASTTYGTNHQYTTDGSPELGDVYYNGSWKTVLVAGLNGGGRGYYAIDVTDPANPLPLWELCADATICAANNDPDIGLTFGNPQFGMYKGKWVVYLTSGYNNVPGTDGVAAGTGGSYLYIVDVETGAFTRTLAGTASLTTPPGLAKITAISADPTFDPTTTFIYGGDNQGQMWRFDLTGATIKVNRMGNAGALQPITTRPEVTICRVKSGTGYVAQNVVAFGTGRLLDVPDVANVDLQSVYLLKDSPTEVTAWRDASTMIKQSFTQVGTPAAGFSYTVTNNTVDLATKSGWYVDFDKNPGERVNIDPKVVAGTLSIVTNMPTSSSACSVGGTSNAYALNVCTGSFVDGSDGVAGGTLSNNSAAVGSIIVRLPSGALKLVVTTADGGNTTIGLRPAITPGTRKVGWRRVRN